MFKWFSLGGRNELIAHGIHTSRNTLNLILHIRRYKGHSVLGSGDGVTKSPKLDTNIRTVEISELKTQQL